jgi:hypothetical protein
MIMVSIPFNALQPKENTNENSSISTAEHCNSNLSKACAK